MKRIIGEHRHLAGFREEGNAREGMNGHGGRGDRGQTEVCAPFGSLFVLSWSCRRLDSAWSWKFQLPRCAQSA
jgi:hypothetical protein